MTSTKKYIVLALLYFTQTVPFSFFGTAIPVILRQKGFSLEHIGYFQLIGLPYMIKFLWAPLIDKYSRTKGYIGWIQIATLLYAGFTLITAFFVLENTWAIMLLLLLAISCLSTQDIAVDAMAVQILHKEERSIGNGIQAGGNYFGFLFGGGILLMTYQYLGWAFTMVLMAGIVILPLFKLKKFRPREKVTSKQEEKVSLKDLVSYFKVPEFKTWIPLLLLIMIPVMVVFHSLKPLLADKGFSLSQVALVFGIFAMLAGMLAGLISGYAFKKASRRNKLLITAVANIMAAGAAIFITFLPFSSFYPITAFCLFIGLVSGLNYMVISAVSMEFIRPGKEGTDYAFQSFLRGFLIFPLMPLTGFFADHLGYAVMFALMGVWAIITAMYIVFKFR